MTKIVGIFCLCAAVGIICATGGAYWFITATQDQRVDDARAGCERTIRDRAANARAWKAARVVWLARARDPSASKLEVEAASNVARVYLDTWRELESRIVDCDVAFSK